MCVDIYKILMVCASYIYLCLNVIIETGLRSATNSLLLQLGAKQKLFNMEQILNLYYTV